MKMDGNLLIDLKNGDEKAFETLFWEYNSMYIILFIRCYMINLWRRI
jgi:hypothetical protein